MNNLEYKEEIVYKSPVLKAFRGFDTQKQDINVLQNIAACEFVAPEYN